MNDAEPFGSAPPSPSPAAAGEGWGEGTRRRATRPRPGHIPNPPPIVLILVLTLTLAACGGSVAPPSPIAGVSASQEASPQPADDAAAAPPTEAPAPSPTANPPTPTPAATASPVPTPKPGAVTVVPILMYHYIRELPPNTPDQLGYGLSIAPKLFDAELAYLAGAHYDTVSMDDVSNHITKGAPLPPKPIVLSFDDGYSDFFAAAWPLLKKYHLGATVYLVVDFLGKPGYMSWPQAQELRDAGVDVGAHTLDHVDLAIQPPAQAKRQIDDSRHILQQRLNAPVDSFAYPSGRYTQATVKLVADAGFSSAVTTSFGARHTASTMLTMARVRVPGGISMPNFIKNLNG
jgi:peptidoglycan/xylan/chitin deacetylase (PgdA/CDA1 family)